jgi:dynein heavy chain 1, cytosolic
LEYFCALVSSQLERWGSLLLKIQKHLRETLRFYFVGDDDLLEIIGMNMSCLKRNCKYLFAGVDTLLLNEEQTYVLGLASKEGEEVCFPHSVLG